MVLLYIHNYLRIVYLDAWHEVRPDLLISATSKSMSIRDEGGSPQRMANVVSRHLKNCCATEAEQ